MSDNRLIVPLTEAAERLGVSERTLRRMSSRGKFPRLLKLGKRAVVSRPEFDQWWSDFLKLKPAN